MIIKTNRYELTPEVYKVIKVIHEQVEDELGPHSREEIYSILMAAGVESLLSKSGLPTDMNEWKTINTSKDKRDYGI